MWVAVGSYQASERRLGIVRFYEKYRIMTENNGRSLAGVLVGGVDIGSGTYIFEEDPSVGVSMSSVAHACRLCAGGLCSSKS